MKPPNSFGPGERTRAIIPAMKPIMMIQIMFDTVISPLNVAYNLADQTCNDPLSSTSARAT